jgi:TonB-dependent Receptor Plug Domain
MIQRRTYFRSYASPGPGVPDYRLQNPSAKLRCLALFLFFSAQCLVVGSAQSNSAPIPSPTPTPNSGASVQPGVITNGTLSPVIGQEEISERPILRPGEVMETIPGMIVTQHAGGGKANQYFLRGFNLDHGTDFATDFNGVPINLPTHAHGEGYTDLNFLIQKLDYAKGPYYAQYGDFASAGAADIQYVDRLPQNIALGTIGEDGYYRGLLAVSHTLGENDLYGYNGQDRVVPAVNPGTFLGAIEAFHNDGPWDPPENFRKLNFVLRYSQGSAADGFSLMLNGYSGAWTGEQQIPERAIRHHDIGYFGNLDPSDGGDSQRYMFTAEWHGQLTDSFYTKAILYSYYYDLDLFSDFTYFLDNPILGDQFEQKDQHIVSGLTIDHKMTDQWFGRDVINDFGLQVRNDYIFDIALNYTRQRNVYAQLTDDRVIETSVSETFSGDRRIW